MKKFLFTVALFLGFAGMAAAQNGNGNNLAARAIAEARQVCDSPLFNNSNWELSSYKQYDIRCAVDASTTGLGSSWNVVASYKCNSEICPAIADQIIATVNFCGNDVIEVLCY